MLQLRKPRWEIQCETSPMSRRVTTLLFLSSSTISRAMDKMSKASRSSKMSSLNRDLKKAAVRVIAQMTMRFLSAGDRGLPFQIEAMIDRVLALSRLLRKKAS